AGPNPQRPTLNALTLVPNNPRMPGFRQSARKAAKLHGKGRNLSGAPRILSPKQVEKTADGRGDDDAQTIHCRGTSDYGQGHRHRYLLDRTLRKGRYGSI